MEKNHLMSVALPLGLEHTPRCISGWYWKLSVKVVTALHFSMLVNVPEAEAPKAHCPRRIRGHLERTGSSRQKGFFTAHRKPAVVNVNVNVMSSIIPSGMLSGHTLRGCFDEIMI